MGFNQAKKKEDRRTYEGGRAFKISQKSELYLLVVSSLMSGDTLYEKMDGRLARFRDLVGKVLVDPAGADWVSKLAVYAREQMHMRTTPTMLIAELFMHGYTSEGSAASWRVFLRGDEHLEALAYTDVCEAKRTKKFLKCIAAHLNGMNQRQMVKYAAGRKSYSQKDAIRVSHPVPKSEEQSALFKYAVHGWKALSDEEKGRLDHISKLKAGETQTWEQNISKHGSIAETWAESVPKMGYMAKLRNLRNMVEKNVPEAYLLDVARDIENPTKVRFSKQLPFRFLSAWRSLPDNTPGYLMTAVAKALDLSVINVPDLEGETLVLVDTSGSMGAALSGRSSVSMKDAALTIGSILVNSSGADLVCFGTVPVFCRVVPGTPALGIIQQLGDISYETGHGTNIGAAILAGLQNRLDYQRIIICTDMQTRDHANPVVANWLGSEPNRHLYVIDLAGYGRPSFESSIPGVHMLSGFSDKVFNWIEAVEKSDPVTMIGAYQ